MLELRRFSKRPYKCAPAIHAHQPPYIYAGDDKGGQDPIMQLLASPSVLRKDGTRDPSRPETLHMARKLSRAAPIPRTTSVASRKFLSKQRHHGFDLTHLCRISTLNTVAAEQRSFAPEVPVDGVPMGTEKWLHAETNKYFSNLANDGAVRRQA